MSSSRSKPFIITLLLSWCVVLVSNTGLFAQTPEIDSLKREIERLPAESNARAQPLYELAMAYKNTDPGRFQQTLAELYDVATANNNMVAKGNFHVLLAEWFWQTQPSDTLFVHLDSARQYFQQARDLDGMLRTMGVQANALAGIGEIEAAVEIHQQQLQLAEEYGNDLQIYLALKGLGPKLMWSGRDTAALAIMHRAALMMQLQNNPIELAQILGNIGFYYIENDLPQKAEPYVKTMYKLISKSGQKGMLPIANAQMGILYQHEEQYDSAAFYFEKTVAAAEAAANPGLAMSGMAQLGQLYYLMGKFEAGRPLLETSLPAMEAMQRYDMLMTSSLQLAHIQVLTGEVGAGLARARELESQLEGMQDPAMRLQMATLLADIYTEAGRYERANTYHQMEVALRDSVFDREQAEKMGRLTAEFDLERQQQIERELQAAAEAEALARNRTQFMLIFAALAVVISGLLFLRSLRIPARIRDGMLFFAMLMLFEAVIMSVDPYIMDQTDGMPLPTLVANAVLAVGFTLLHGRVENAYQRLRKKD